MPIPFPRFRLHEFHEHRIRRPIKGSLLEEQADEMLTERVTPRLKQWLGRNEHLVFAPSISHISTPLSGDEQMISVCYILLIADKSDVSQLAWGGEA